jgi:preprotein translocase subunit SecG
MLGYYAIVALHVLVCFILILVVLLQSGKGADLAGAFGGAGTQTAFGSRGPASFLSKVTTGAAVVFMITSISLTILSGGGASRSVMDEAKGSAAAGAKTPAPAAGAAADTKVPTPEEIRKLQEEAEAKQQAPPAKAPEQPPTPPAKQTPVPDKKSPGEPRH